MFGPLAAAPDQQPDESANLNQTDGSAAEDRWPVWTRLLCVAVAVHPCTPYCLFTAQRQDSHTMHDALAPLFDPRVDRYFLVVPNGLTIVFDFSELQFACRPTPLGRIRRRRTFYQLGDALGLSPLERTEQLARLH